MKCPFKKTTVYTAGRRTGGREGYPVSWTATEEFEDCIGSECAVYNLINTACTAIIGKAGGCMNCQKED